MIGNDNHIVNESRTTFNIRVAAMLAVGSVFFSMNANADSTLDKRVNNACGDVKESFRVECRRVIYENLETCAVEGFCDKLKLGIHMDKYKAANKQLNAGIVAEQ